MTDESSSLCFYYRDDAEVVFQHGKYTNKTNLIGSYQYSSSHLINSEWIVSEDTYGKMSKFLKWNESDTYYYHLYIVKEQYLIHITSSGSEEVGDDILEMGELLLERFE